MIDSEISIITVCLNCEGLIERTIKSVLDQTYTEYQYVIIDGGSTDNTLNIIKEYENKIDIILSEEDKGIYDAMNKGLEYATGGLIYFLNAGDYLYNDDVLKNVIEGLNANPDSDIIYGDYIYYDNNSEQRCSGYRADVIDLLRGGCCHQTVFAKKSAFMQCGKFDTNYKIYADFDWLLRGLVKFGQRMSYINTPVVYYLKGGESESHGGKYKYEKTEIIQKNIDSQKLLLFAISYPISFCGYVWRSSVFMVHRKLIQFLLKSSP